MSNSPEHILEHYWGYSAFRSLQREIIQEVLDGRDVLALLPTGGGKSLCFQVPAMIKDGICIVVSPLIALMKDQVAHLKAKGIKAVSVTSELDASGLDAIFDRCIYDPEIKFLYLSPERLLTDLAKQRIQQMKVSVIAVDEAHCISEWGYDFRPAYLEIAQLREIHPKVPLIALTASATPKVVDDIQERLKFAKPNVMRKSFARENLAYFVDWAEDKLGQIERIARKQGGAGIVYLRSRKGTERTAKHLMDRGIKADYYHAGLDHQARAERQQAWMSGKSPLIVATNAFGMGIDKADVRYVIHCDLPDTLENYYQECGRAGRDGERSFAVMLVQQKDLETLKEKTFKSFPSKDVIKATYNTLGSYLKLAVGSGKDSSHALDLDGFAHYAKLDRTTVAMSLKFLERDGYLTITERNHFMSEVQIIADSGAVERLREKNDDAGKVLNGLLRSYPRLFDEASAISEWTLAKRAKMPKDRVVEILQWLDESAYITYVQSSRLPKVMFPIERIDPKNVRLSDEHYKIRKHVVLEKTESMLHYAAATHKCRSRLLLEYFGEKESNDCGLCDVCIRTKH